MRLSAYVSEHGLAPFTFDDFIFIGQKVSQDPGRLVLVGGQALETWGVVFDVLAPTGDRHPLTEDTDWLGSRKDAQWLCDLLGKDAELHLPDPSDPTPSSGLAFIERPGQRVIMMDFLRTIAGLENSEIKKLAVSIALKGVTLRVLHPLLCLESRMANLAILPSKRRGNGPMQAEWAINIAAAFLRKSLAADTTQAANGCRRSLNWQNSSTANTAT